MVPKMPKVDFHLVVSTVIPLFAFAIMSVGGSSRWTTNRHFWIATGILCLLVSFPVSDSIRHRAWGLIWSKTTLFGQLQSFRIDRHGFRWVYPAKPGIRGKWGLICAKTILVGSTKTRGMRSVCGSLGFLTDHNKQDKKIRLLFHMYTIMIMRIVVGWSTITSLFHPCECLTLMVFW